ncbi:hypothetical protein DPV78_007767 [Talaromyces pinophilus]|nr:hypothetical protein DPV78_007767 [Talaromyces pinophilus]
MIQQEHKGTGYKVGEVFEIAGDVTDPKTSVTLVDEAVKQWGKLDIFVADGGVLKEAKFLEYIHHFLI